jgi:sugar lactone lactonase YvrE
MQEARRRSRRAFFPNHRDPDQIRRAQSEKEMIIMKSVKHAPKSLKAVLLVGMALLTLTGGAAWAGDIVLYATNEPGGQILSVDLTTNTVTPLLNIAANPDSLIFSGGNVLFTEVNQGILADYNPGTNTVTNIATGFLQPRDLALEPGGNTVLVSDFVNASIDRVNLTTHVVTTLFSGANPDGLTYDNNGNLFAVLNRNMIAQINPTTGAIINKTSIFDNNLDGLTYDPTTGTLWVGSENGAIWQVPESLLSEMSFAAGSIDGLEADGQGNIYLANFGNNVQKFVIATHTLTDLTPVPGLDDLAPLSGLGAAPEPGTCLLFGGGLLGIVARLRRKS